MIRALPKCICMTAIFPISPITPHDEEAEFDEVEVDEEALKEAQAEAKAAAQTEGTEETANSESNE